MRATFAPIALAALVAANPMPQGVTAAIAPQSTAPAGCKNTVDGTFLIELVKIGAKKREVVERDTDYLTLKLNGGILTDAKGRIGSIVANGQFQFDGPPAQEGAIYTAGWTLCPNNTLTLGAETVFYQCLTSTYYNIYDMSIGGQCSPVNIQAIDFNYAGSAPLSQISDGQPQASGAVTQYSDGQPQGPTGVPVSQYSDGQPQAPTGNPVSQYSDGQPQAPTGNPVSQYSDGQPQAPTGKPVSQISDGQPQAPTGKPVSQISDGQPQGPTGAPVSQISDGQPQAPTVTPSRASNATVASTGAVTTSKPATTSPIAATGAAVAQGASAVAMAVGVFAALLL